MITRIREVRRARGLTLEQVGALCDPPTTAQTIGRLETGTRTVSIKWLNRIATALGVAASDLVALPEQRTVPVAALLGPEGARAPTRPLDLPSPAAADDMIGVQVTASIGDYRSGDAIWCRRIAPADFAAAMNRDVLLPRPAGRFLFGRLIGREGDRLQLLPLGVGGRQQVLTDPPWGAVAEQLIRRL
ncbi:helix-turn-helix domain-containing protein [Sphingobium ummariense]|uniref:XRE family transcriptional regulator n=1 Tax=Sphingobium ummariense RL-3 TaxID=1346791 RepID=T0K881_9SPHN|nr:helix-turn-helix transcriptional regulator [Sphingobium ummariense]EQB32874.1 XRE family transcriptional regulator [Sphingobium ummariense RL-3]